VEKKGGPPAAGGATYVELWRRLIIQNIQLYLPTERAPKTRVYSHGRTPILNPEMLSLAGSPDNLVIDRQKSRRSQR